LWGSGLAAIVVGTIQRARINNRIIFMIVGINALLVLDRDKNLLFRGQSLLRAVLCVKVIVTK
jgi:hypothetical protein